MTHIIAQRMTASTDFLEALRNYCRAYGEPTSIQELWATDAESQHLIDMIDYELGLIDNDIQEIEYPDDFFAALMQILHS